VCQWESNNFLLQGGGSLSFRELGVLGSFLPGADHFRSQLTARLTAFDTVPRRSIGRPRGRPRHRGHRPIRARQDAIIDSNAPKAERIPFTWHRGEIREIAKQEARSRVAVLDLTKGRENGAILLVVIRPYSSSTSRPVVRLVAKSLSVMTLTLSSICPVFEPNKTSLSLTDAYSPFTVACTAATF